MSNIPKFLNIVTTQFTAETFKEFMKELYSDVKDLGNNKIEVASTAIYHTFKLEDCDFSSIDEDYMSISIDGVPLDYRELSALSSLMSAVRILEPEEDNSPALTLIKGGAEDEEE